MTSLTGTPIRGQYELIDAMRKLTKLKEEYEGIIKEVYNYIFIIKTDGNEVKSFSYRDVLTNTIELFFDKV